jgi:hypothetical protein
MSEGGVDDHSGDCVYSEGEERPCDADFSTTLLGLMGISSGTYIGFEFPEQKNPVP